MLADVRRQGLLYGIGAVAGDPHHSPASLDQLEQGPTRCTPFKGAVHPDDRKHRAEIPGVTTAFEGHATERAA